MKIENIKDLREVLSNIPDEVLENFIVGVGDEGFGFGCSESQDDSQMVQNTTMYYEKVVLLYPELKLVQKYFDKLIEAVVKEDTDIGIVTVEE